MISTTTVRVPSKFTVRIFGKESGVTIFFPGSSAPLLDLRPDHNRIIPNVLDVIVPIRLKRR